MLCEIFSLAVNTHKTTDEILDEQYDYFAQFSAQIADLQKRYAARKRASNAMDFDDLLALWLKLLQDHADVRDHYQRRFQFILVDEYQDTNKLQSDLIDLLAGRHHNVTVVGDDAQSIYAWRGANFENIFKFPKRYPDAKVFKIETNYRSTPEILKVANAAIAANRNQFTKILAPARKSGMKPALVACMDAAQQAAFISQRVIELREEGTSMNQIAVLYRSHFHALELQLELTKRQIPFSITSGIRFFEQAHIKDATAYLKLVANPRDETRLQTPRAIAARHRRQRRGKNLEDFSVQKSDSRTQKPSDQRLTTACNVRSSVAAALQACAKSVPAKAATAWAQFVATISQLEDETVRKSAAKMLRLVMDAGYDDYLKENFANYRTRLEDLEQLAVFAYQFNSVEDFLTQLALLTNVEAEDGQAAQNDSRKNPALDDSSGEGSGIRRRVRHHAVRRIVSVLAFA